MMQIYVYSFIPAIIMCLFNSLIGIKTLNLNSHINHQDQNAIKNFNKRKRITISLCVISISFMIMTLPSTIYWAFFVNHDSLSIFFNIGGLLDFVSFLNHASIFYTSYLTNMTFKKYVNRCLTNLVMCGRSKTRIQSNSQNNSIINISIDINPNKTTRF